MFNCYGIINLDKIMDHHYQYAFKNSNINCFCNNSIFKQYHSNVHAMMHDFMDFNFDYNLFYLLVDTHIWHL